MKFEIEQIETYFSKLQKVDYFIRRRKIRLINILLKQDGKNEISLKFYCPLIYPQIIETLQTLIGIYQRSSNVIS